MNHSIILGGLAGCLLLASVPVPAARISEPGTTFYGRIVSRVGETEFPVTQGEFSWTISVPNQGDREYTLKGRVESIAGGRFSYRLVVPHQVLAFDLAVEDRQIPLTAVGWKMRHVKVRVNGKDAVIAAPAADSFTAGQSARASAYRVDLVLPTLSSDSDGDGFPDWWEDEKGTDKWNPQDHPAIPGHPGSTTEGNTDVAAGVRTFGEWQRRLFPDSQEEPSSFARKDSNGDGIPHLLEYAFQLDPSAPASLTSNRLPRAVTVDGRLGITFQPRTDATDLDYQVEASGDLVQWTSSSELIEQVPVRGADAAPGEQSFATRPGTEGVDALFLRVRVSLK